MSLLFPIFFSFLSLLLSISLADSNATNPSSPPPPLPPPPPMEERRDSSPFKPSVAVVIAVLTTMFSITLLLLLYAKHCKRRNDEVYNHQNQSYFDGYGTSVRKNSGINRTVIESLPVFRFGSLRGQKDGLECAVCLARFEPAEVLRLLPKCKHAFHVECVDTWLDAHSTCPLCRYRVDAEDILLVGDCNLWQENPEDASNNSCNNNDNPSRSDPTRLENRRVSGRHSSAGERGSNLFVQIESSRKSMDGSTRSKSEIVTVGCFDRPQRKDGLLIPDGLINDRKSFERRFEHRIILAGARGRDQRWSDVRPSDLLYLRSEMILSDSRRLEGSGKSVIKGRSVSEITGVGRFSSSSRVILNNSDDRHNQRQRQAAGVVSRWLAWAGVRSHRTPGSSLT